MQITQENIENLKQLIGVVENESEEEFNQRLAEWLEREFLGADVIVSDEVIAMLDEAEAAVARGDFETFANGDEAKRAHFPDLFAEASVAK